MMKRICILSFVSYWLLLVAAANAQEPAAPIDRIVLEDGDVIVFLGDSITYQSLYTQYVENYLYTRFPDKRFEIHNAGVGGSRARDALNRFDEDVASHQPKYVTVLLGMNDGNYRTFRQELFDTYRQDMTALLARLDEINARTILMTPTMFDSRAARAGDWDRGEESTALYNAVLAYYGSWLREIAVEQGRGFVDLWGPLNNITLEQRKTDPEFTMIADAVHPRASGHVVIAAAIISDMGLSPEVSSIRIVGGDTGPQVQAAGGRLSDLSWSDGEVSFTWAANSLPWVLPEEAQVGVELVNLGQRLSRESLEVHGLAPGRYELSIDGEVVGTYDRSELVRHIELQENPATPQYQQALRVAELNKQRNEGPVRALRREWAQLQRYTRARGAVDAAPDDVELVQQLEATKEKVEGMSDRVIEQTEAAREIEEQIFEINMPPPRKYVLKKVD